MRKNIISILISLLVFCSFFNLGFTQNLTTYQQKIQELKQQVAQENLTQVVNDPAVASAVNNLNMKVMQIAQNCLPENAQLAPSEYAKVNSCICTSIHKAITGNEIDVAAFEDLLNRRPDLKDKLIQITGASGKWQLSSSNLKESIIAEFKKMYNCN